MDAGLGQVNLARLGTVRSETPGQVVRINLPRPYSHILEKEVLKPGTAVTATIASVFTMLGTFITNFFTNAGTVLNSIMAQEVLAMFVIIVPVFGLLVGLLFRLFRRRA